MGKADKAEKQQQPEEAAAAAAPVEQSYAAKVKFCAGVVFAHG